MISPDIQPFRSPNGGHTINSRRQMQEDLARSGAYAWEKGIEQDIAQNTHASGLREAKAFSGANASHSEKAAQAAHLGAARKSRGKARLALDNFGALDDIA